MTLVAGRKNSWGLARGIYGFTLLAAVFFASQPACSQARPSRIEGPNACVECHKKEGEIWQQSHHYSTFRDMPRSKEARLIAKKMKIKRMKSSSLCLGCHFTTQKAKKKKKPIAGISCESCHGEGKATSRFMQNLAVRRIRNLNRKARRQNGGRNLRLPA